jgi:hypothetical protein
MTSITANRTANQSRLSQTLPRMTDLIETVTVLATALAMVSFLNALI